MEWTKEADRALLLQAATVALDRPDPAALGAWLTHTLNDELNAILDVVIHLRNRPDDTQDDKLAALVRHAVIAYAIPTIEKLRGK
jgi:hypothetical protein